MLIKSNNYLKRRVGIDQSHWLKSTSRLDSALIETNMAETRMIV